MNLIAILSMGLLGVTFALGLALAHKNLKVEEPEEVQEVHDRLPGVDCGACGYASCEAMAEAIVEGEATPDECPVSDQEAVEDIADFMGLSLDGGEEKLIARVLCQGGRAETERAADYRGVETCAGADLIGTGGKSCTFGCLGFGDCVVACDFEAIEMNENRLPEVDAASCTGCGDCVEACPRDLIELHPADRGLFVWCKSHDDAATSRSNCDVACIACGLCARECDGVEMKDDLASVDHSQTDECDPGVDSCPTGAIDYV